MVFLVCHSVKLFINGYECYELVKKNMEESAETINQTQSLQNEPRLTAIPMPMNKNQTTETDEIEGDDTSR